MEYPDSIRGLNSPTNSASSQTADDEKERPPPECPFCQDNPRKVRTTDLKPPHGKLAGPCHGWPKLAQLIAENPSFESFQSFRDLNIKSLLYYQAELVDLKEQLHEIEWRDHLGGGVGDSPKMCENVQTILRTASSVVKKEKRQLEKIKEIRKVLKEYNKALLLYSQINELPEADDVNVKCLRTWLRTTGKGNGELQIQGPGKDTWGDLAKPDERKSLGLQLWVLLRGLVWAEHVVKSDVDLVIPRKKRELDGLTRWVAHEWIPFWHNLTSAVRKVFKPPQERLPDPSPSTMRREERLRRFSSSSTLVQSIRNSFSRLSSSSGGGSGNSPGHGRESVQGGVPSATKPGDNLTTYRMSRMLRFTSFVATVVACLLPTVAIAVLATMHSQRELLGFIALFTAIFAVGLMGLTDSGTSRTEIFTATAAFSAVLVVFVQNQNGGSNGAPG